MSMSTNSAEESQPKKNAPLSIICNDAPYATISELAEIYDIETNIVQQRLEAHWSLEKALTTHN
ncbi:hypothetical protein [Celerinatantimonas sp. MCCC 1A17872]|uniref:hypothetical protein n=1 Tax=Celerinatantimonas sp. MCCC 1A17872 TaxID=3177514 RepID=UPI0038C17293